MKSLIEFFPDPNANRGNTTGAPLSVIGTVELLTSVVGCLLLFGLCLLYCCRKGPRTAQLALMPPLIWGPGGQLPSTPGGGSSENTSRRSSVDNNQPNYSSC